MKFSLVFTAVLLATIGYGVSFPLLSISLEKLGVESSLIGLNAAMPALGWVLVSPFLPKLQRRFSIRLLLLAFLFVSLAGLAGFTTTSNYGPWLFFRFLFGGGLGMFFRVVEYWINTATIKSNRGKITGIYSVSFFVGIVVGSSLQPVFGTVGYLPYLFIFASLLLAGAVLLFVDLSVSDSQKFKSASLPKFALIFKAAPIAIAGVIAFGLFEDIPAYLLSVYALKSGLTEGIAAYTLTAVAIGNLIFPIPLGILSDRIG